MTKKIQARTAATRMTRKPGATAGKRRPKAKTAWELCERVCEAIAAKPLNYYQGMWSGDTQWVLDPARAAKADCGTIFCRAGWLVALHDGARNINVNTDRVIVGQGLETIANRATTLLGLSSNDRSSVLELFDGEAVCGRPGTRAYAAEGVRGLRAFMKQHEAHLKARSLKGV